MFDLSAYVHGLTVVIGAAVLTWLLSLYLRNVAIVDTLWSVLFALLAWTYALGQTQWELRAAWVLLLVTLWALRLSIHITRRNWGHPEDRRYRAIRARNEPHFALKSLYLVFILQALLAWVISLPVLGAIASREPPAALDYVGGALWLVGFVFEAGGDWQLARFKATPGNDGKVMDRGFWSLTRHPNYFGDFCVWWGLYLIALSAGAWWSLPGPLLMSVLLLRVSGVALLEKDIGERRPQYGEYVRRTNAFFPGPRKRA
jgi:steroid 5-alpha reductase family enzyme